MATNLCHWLKVQSRWFKHYMFEKKYFDQLLDFQILLLLFFHTSLLCHILLFGCWIFSIPSGCQTVWIQIMPCILLGLIWVQTVCKGYQQTTKCLAGSGFKLLQKLLADNKSGQRVQYKKTCWYFFLAKTLAKVNFFWLQHFRLG